MGRHSLRVLLVVIFSLFLSCVPGRWYLRVVIPDFRNNGIAGVLVSNTSHPDPVLSYAAWFDRQRIEVRADGTEWLPFTLIGVENVTHEWTKLEPVEGNENAAIVTINIWRPGYYRVQTWNAVGESEFSLETGRIGG